MLVKPLKFYHKKTGEYEKNMWDKNRNDYYSNHELEMIKNKEDKPYMRLINKISGK